MSSLTSGAKANGHVGSNKTWEHTGHKREKITLPQGRERSSKQTHYSGDLKGLYVYVHTREINMRITRPCVYVYMNACHVFACLSTMLIREPFKMSWKIHHTTR